TKCEYSLYYLENFDSYGTRRSEIIEN
ncbi:unnamed protein product, partial [Allacma fusca]